MNSNECLKRLNIFLKEKARDNSKRQNSWCSLKNIVTPTTVLGKISGPIKKIASLMSFSCSSQYDWIRIIQKEKK